MFPLRLFPWSVKNVSYSTALISLLFGDGIADITALYKFLNNVRSRISKSSYGQDMKGAIVRYTRALDERDWNTAFLKLWSLLEFLTFSLNENYKTTIKRASFIFEESDYHLQVLNHLREYRNKSVHAGVDNTEIETYLYQLKNYVEALLEFHLGNSYGFESLKAASTFLSLSTAHSDLENQIKIRKYAQKFHGNEP